MLDSHESIGDYLESAQKNLLEKGKYPAGLCGTIAAKVALLLLEEGKEPYILHFREWIPLGTFYQSVL